ncbi:MAG: quinoprotein dehydrogenase-associated SoxYZ-like carrier [Kiloniellaceae bacterium]
MQSSTAVVRRRLPAVAALALFGAALVLWAGSARAEDTAWDDIRQELYGTGREILPAAGIIALEAPYRALDAATVPITVSSQIPQSDDRYIKTLTLVVDENPAPIVGTFHFSPANGIASVSTRVRVNAYTNIRAIAETNDGQLYMAAAYVKASGGCSAPASSDQEAALARMGKMKLKQIGAWRQNELSEAQFQVSHPNYSGMQQDQMSQLWIPALYVRSIDLTLGQRELLRFEGDISISENPTFRFFVKPQGSEILHATVIASDDEVFEQSWPIQVEPSS